MSPREDLESLIDDSARIVQGLVAVNPPGIELVLDSKTVELALQAIDGASRGITWHVYATDTGNVFSRLIELVEDFRAFLFEIGADQAKSQFKDDALLDQANRTLGVLHRHQKLVALYDESMTQRLSRPIVDHDGELAVLEKQGTQARKAVLDLLHNMRRSLGRS